MRSELVHIPWNLQSCDAPQKQNARFSCHSKSLGRLIKQTLQTVLYKQILSSKFNYVHNSKSKRLKNSIIEIHSKGNRILE